MLHLSKSAAAVVLVVLGCGVQGNALGSPVVRSASGVNAAAISPARDQFRIDLGGGTVAGANGLFQDATGARREINWDGVPAAMAAPNNLNANFFNVNSPRGVVFSTAGTGFQVSGATTDVGAGQPAAAAFGHINPGYTSTFAPFSVQRLFTALGSTITDINFFVPGTTTPATVSGFGAVFSDADLASTTRIEYFDANNQPLFSQFASATAGQQTFSFLGVSFNAGEQIGRVRITSGNSALGAAVNDGGTTDLVVMDDFLYSNPVPEPVLAPVIGGFLLAMRRRRRA